MRRRRNVKVLATLGPNSSTRERIRQLFIAGADCFRLNMSHGSQADIRARYDMIRDVEAELGRPICVLADLQGPKLRVGVFANGAETLENGAAFRLDLDKAEGDARRVNLPHPEILQALRPGAMLLVNDGKIRLKVTACGPDFAETEVVVGGEISNRKGVNVPDVVLPMTAMTDKDRADLEFACRMGVDWLALSFVQRASDVEEARALAKGRAAIMAKIEKPAAVEALDSILAVSDGVMVARGDLGVELPIASVPLTQKCIVEAARRLGMPVVVATQMLESMIEAPTPTRAEVSDVANAILEGADAVMLSAESAVGAYPVEAVAMMNEIAETVEKSPQYRGAIEGSRTKAQPTVADAITAAAREIAETAQVAAIVCFTDTGTTAQRASRERPRVPILAITARTRSARKLGIVWGLHCVVSAQEPARFRDCVEMSVEKAQQEEFARVGDQVVIVAGVPYGTPGTTNILRVATIDQNGKPRAV